MVVLLRWCSKTFFANIKISRKDTPRSNRMTNSCLGFYLFRIFNSVSLGNSAPINSSSIRKFIFLIANDTFEGFLIFSIRLIVGNSSFWFFLASQHRSRMTSFAKRLESILRCPIEAKFINQFIGLASKASFTYYCVSHIRFLKTSLVRAARELQLVCGSRHIITQGGICQ